MTKKKSMGHIASRYLLWILASVGCVYLMLQLRETLLLGLALSLDNIGVLSPLRTVDQWFVIVAAIASITCIGIIEQYLRKARDGRTLAMRFVRVFGWQLLVMALNALIRAGLAGFARVRGGDIVAIVVPAVAGALCLSAERWWSLLRPGTRTAPPPAGEGPTADGG